MSHFPHVFIVLIISSNLQSIIHFVSDFSAPHLDGRVNWSRTILVTQYRKCVTNGCHGRPTQVYMHLAGFGSNKAYIQTL